MYMAPFIVQSLHEERVRDAQQHAHNRLLRDLSEPETVEADGGLIHWMKQFVQGKDHAQASNDVRHAHAA